MTISPIWSKAIHWIASNWSPVILILPVRWRSIWIASSSCKTRRSGSLRRASRSSLAKLVNAARGNLAISKSFAKSAAVAWAIVYEAWQISLDRRVALKVLPFAALLDSKQITRFRNEAQAAAQLHHLHIVPVFFVGVERGVHYYAMQFIDGQSLDRAIEELRHGARSEEGSASPPDQNTPNPLATEHEKDDVRLFSYGCTTGDPGGRGTCTVPTNSGSCIAT